MTVTATPSRTGTLLIGGGRRGSAHSGSIRRARTSGRPRVGLRPQGMPETGRIKESFGLYAKASGMTWEQFQELLASRTHTRRLSTLAGMANVAVFVASDQASGITGTVINLSMGSMDD
jgi:hypothetical protein